MNEVDLSALIENVIRKKTETPKPHICPSCEAPHKSNNIPIGKCSMCQKLSNLGVMVTPLRRSLDYESLARKIINVQPMPNQSIPIYDKDKE